MSRDFQNMIVDSIEGCSASSDMIVHFRYQPYFLVITGFVGITPPPAIVDIGERIIHIGPVPIENYRAFRDKWYATFRITLESGRNIDIGNLLHMQTMHYEMHNPFIKPSRSGNHSSRVSNISVHVAARERNHWKYVLQQLARDEGLRHV